MLIVSIYIVQEVSLSDDIVTCGEVYTGTLAQVTLCRMFDTHNSFSLQIAS